jgi:hypothetical protein
MLFPIVAFVLATRGEIGVGDANESGFRLFLLNDAAFQGIGIERRRQIDSEDNCLQSTLNFLLWEGENDNLDITFCQCFDEDTGFADPSQACQPFQ